MFWCNVVLKNRKYLRISSDRREDLGGFSNVV